MKGATSKFVCTLLNARNMGRPAAPTRIVERVMTLPELMKDPVVPKSMQNKSPEEMVTWTCRRNLSEGPESKWS